MCHAQPPLGILIYGLRETLWNILACIKPVSRYNKPRERQFPESERDSPMSILFPQLLGCCLKCKHRINMDESSECW